MGVPVDAKRIAAALARADPERVARASVPIAPGFYAWWARPERLIDSTPEIPAVQPAGGPADWALLYVGIAPKRPSRTGVDRTIAARISKDHRGGTIGGSTLRQSLAALLRDSLGLSPRLGRDRPRLLDEQPLSQWIVENCALTTAVRAEPWTIEEEVIRLTAAPLNLVPGYHDFRHVVREARERLRRDCGV
jgi:hypothetical protein